MMRKKYIFKSLLLLSFLAMETGSFAQTTKPADNIVPKGGTYQTTLDGVGMTYKGNLNDLKLNNATSVKLTSSSVLLGLGGVYPASLQFEYTTPITAKNPYYFRLSNSSSFSGVLLGGALGGLLDAVLFGNHWIEVTPYLNGTVINGGGRTDNYWNQSTTSNLAVMEDGNQMKYIRIVPSSIYDRVLLTEATAGGLAAVNSSEYEYAYYYDDPAGCGIPLMTSFTGKGGLLSVGAQNPVTNAYKSVDNDPASYSAIGGNTLLNVGLGSEVEQFFYLPTSTTEKMISFKMSIPSGLLKVDVANQSSIVFYKDNQKVGEVPMNSSVLGVDLLGLINMNNAPFRFMVIPPLDLITDPTGGTFLAYDKISVKIVKPVSVDLLGGSDLRIYDVVLADIKPDVVKVCTREFMNGNIRERKFDITQIIPNYNSATEYVVVNKEQKEILFKTPADKNANKWQPLGTYYIKGITAPGHCPLEYSSFAVVQNVQYKITGKSAISIPLDDNNDGTADAQVTFNPTLYSSDLPNGTGVRIFDELTNIEVTGQTIPFTKIGNYNYYAIVKNAVADANVTCDIVKRITVYVYDKDECEYRYVQRMATNSTTGTVLTGGTIDSAKAADKDLSTHGTIFNVLNVAGIGTAWIDLKFDNIATQPIAAGTPITIKLGQEYSLLQLIGGTTIQVLDKTGTITGPLLSINEVDLLNVLVGDNVFEYTFIPKNTAGTPIEYGGVRILNGGLLGVATSAKVYGAYIDERIPLNQAGACDSNIPMNGAEIVGNQDAHIILNTSAKDVLYGVEDAGLGVATALSGVLYSYLSADAIENHPTNPALNGTPNYGTAAVFNTSVGALNRQTLTVKFKDVARPGDKIRIVMSAEGAPILDLNLLSNFTIQRYMGDMPIGDEVQSSAFEIIKLDLLKLIADQASDKYVITLEGIGASFDRVELRMDNVVSANLLGAKTHVWDVSLLPYFAFDSTNNELCTAAPLEIEKLDPCTSYELSFAYATLSTTKDPLTGEYDILGWNDIQNSKIDEITSSDPRYNEDSHKFQLKGLHTQFSKDNNLYLKVVTKRQGCIYGDTQYLRVKIRNCASIVNPMIRTRLKSN